MAKKSMASRMQNQRSSMTPEQRKSEMNKVVSKVSGKQSNKGGSGKGPLGSRKRLSGPRNKSQEKRDLTTTTSPSEPMAYKKSSCTYKLPGQGSRENYSEGTFREDNRAMQAGLIVKGGFGDLRGSYEGGTVANFMMGEMGETEDIGGGSGSTVGDITKRRHEREQANNEMLAETVSTKDIGANLGKRDLV